MPILKRKKSKSRDCHGYFRPVNLLSCLGKVVERLVLQVCLFWKLEHDNLLHLAQSRHGKARCIQDQVLKVTKTTVDRVQRRQRTVMALVDFRSAFDPTWRARPLWKIADV